MSKKSLKESIQNTVKGSILQEKWTDIIPQAASGIANMGRNIVGQYSLGGIDKRFQRVADRIEKDWKSSADEIASKANKLQGSGNEMIAKQGQATLSKVDNISKQLNQALQILKAPADSSLQRGGDENDPFNKTEEQKKFMQWIKNYGGDTRDLNKKEYGDYFKKWVQLKHLGLHPENIAPGDMQREIAIASHKQHVSLRDLDKQLRGSNAYGLGLGAEFIGANEEGEEDATSQVPPPPKNQATQQVSPPDPAGSKKINPGMFADLMQKQQANKRLPIPPPKQATPQGGSGANAATPSAKQNTASQGNVAAPKTVADPSPPPMSAMQSPQRQKGQAAPPPIDLAKYQKVSPPLMPQKGQMDKPTQMAPEVRQKGQAAPPPQSQEQPIPLTRKKKHVMEMPPREEFAPGKAVPSSIQGMLPPIKDDGKQIQVGSEEKPAISPRNDTLKTKVAKKKATNSKKTPTKKKTKK